MRGSRHAIACGLAAVFALGCGRSEAPPPVAAPAPAAANRPPLPPTKVTARYDAGGLLHLSWSGASDPESPAAQLATEVLLGASPFATGKPGSSSQRFPAGATEAVLESPLRDPIIAVRTVDPQGSLSAPVSPVSIEAAPGRSRWPSGDPELSLTDCAWFGEKGLLCTGENGAAARLVGTTWNLETTGLRGALRLVTSPVAAPWLRTDEGRLLVPAPKEGWQNLRATLAEPYPQGPLRDMQGDAFGLTHLIDANGAVWLGDSAHLLPMTAPLALVESCDRLRAVAFSAQAGLAICESGQVYSVATDKAGMQWLPLTGTTEPLPDAGILQLLADSPAEAIVVEPARIRRVAVGGWTTLLDATMAGVSEPLRIGRAVALLGEPSARYFPTSAGLAKLEAGIVSIVGGSPTGLVGAVPDAPAPGQFILVDRDGTRFAWRGTSFDSVSPRPLRADLLFHAAADLLVAITPVPAQPAEPAALLRVGPPGGVDVRLNAGLRTASGSLIIAGSESGNATVWTRAGDGWSAERLAADGIRPAAVVAVDETSDGRRIAATDHEVFVAKDGRWSHHSTQSATLREVFTTSDGFLLFGDGATLSCTETGCTAATGPVADGAGIRQWHEGGGRWSVARDGTLRRLAANGWQKVSDALPKGCADGISGRLVGEGFDLVMATDGHLRSFRSGACESAGRMKPGAQLLLLDGKPLVADADGIHALSLPSAAATP